MNFWTLSTINSFLSNVLTVNPVVLNLGPQNRQLILRGLKSGVAG